VVLADTRAHADYYHAVLGVPAAKLAVVPVGALPLPGASGAARELAGANTVFVMVYCFGGVLGPSLGGLAMDLWRPTGLVAFVSGAAALLVLGLVAGRRQRAGSRPRQVP